MSKFYVKIFEIGGDRIVSICDKEIYGKVLEDKDRGIKIIVDAPFYGGILMDLDEAIEVIKNSTIINLIGNRIVDVAIDHGLILENAVIKVQGIKHVQIIQYNISK